MRIQSEYMSFKNRWMISSSYDFQAHLQHSQRCFSQTAPLLFKVLPDLYQALGGLSYALPDLSPALSDLSSALPDLSPALPDLSSPLPDFSPALQSAHRCTQSSLRCSEVFRNLSQSLQWYSCTSHPRSQLLWRPAGMPFYCLILPWN